MARSRRQVPGRLGRPGRLGQPGRWWRITGRRRRPGTGRSRALLAEDVVYEVPQTRERVTGREAYPVQRGGLPRRLAPGGAAGLRTAAVSMIEFPRGHQPVRAVLLHLDEDGRIVRITDFWPDPYEPPAGAPGRCARPGTGRQPPAGTDQPRGQCPPGRRGSGPGSGSAAGWSRGHPGPGRRPRSFRLARGTITDVVFRRHLVPAAGHAGAFEDRLADRRRPLPED